MSFHVISRYPPVACGQHAETGLSGDLLTCSDFKKKYTCFNMAQHGPTTFKKKCVVLDGNYPVLSFHVTMCSTLIYRLMLTPMP
jgi:hypothetical protein